MAFPDWIEKLLAERPPINRRLLDEYVLVYKPWNRSQCLGLIEDAEEVTRAEAVNSIISVLLGTSTRLFKWDQDTGQFVVSNGYRLATANVNFFREYLKPFGVLGSYHRKMMEWTEDIQVSNGEVFIAFQLALRDLLIDVSQHVYNAKRYFAERNMGNGDEVRLVAILPWLDQDDRGNLPLVIRTLWSIYNEINKKPKVNLERNKPLSQQSINIKQIYLIHTLVAISNRIVIPHRRIRALVYTMLDRCLGAFFRITEQHLANFESVDQLNSLELPLTCCYADNYELTTRKCHPSAMNTFWTDFVRLDLDNFNDLALFDKNSLNMLVEAIKCSFALRINGLVKVANNNLKPGTLMEAFREELERLLRCYMHKDDKFDIRTDSTVEVYSCEILQMFGVPPSKSKYFRPFQMPIRMSRDMIGIMREALMCSFERVSRPIINEFLGQISYRYRRLFINYADFYLVQHPQPMLRYVYMLFPALKDYLVSKDFSFLERFLRDIHKSDTSEYGPEFRSIQPVLGDLEKLRTYSDLVELSVDIFENIFFRPISPKTADKEDVFNFWPLTQMFNSQIICLYNQIFQFLLRLRFFMFIIGNDFIVSNAFKSGGLTKNSYLFRFRLANMIIYFAQQIEYHLKEVVSVTIRRLEMVKSFKELLEEHQRFLVKLEKININIVGNEFVKSVLRSVSKFALAGRPDSRPKRRLSIQNAIGALDSHNPVDIFNSILK